MVHKNCFDHTFPKSCDIYVTMVTKEPFQKRPRVINTLFSAGYFPDMWTEVYIIPLHKKETLTHLNITEELLFSVCLKIVHKDN